MTLSGHRGGGRSVVFGPGGNRIITGSDDGTVKVWDAERGVELMTLNANIPILSVAFSPDGKSIAASASAQVILWESEVPAGGYGPRKNGEVARKIVDELYDKLGYYCEIINKLQADKTLDEPLRKLALQIADSRKWWDAETFNDESWEVVSSPDKDAEDYKLAMEKAAKATRMEPNDCGMLNTLGIAQYRLGAYQDALMTLSRADKMRTDANQPSTVEDWAFIAMSLHKLGRVDEAKVSLERLGTFLQEERFLDYEEAKAFLGEAEKLIEGEKQ
jgi:tetratricopeptide (TPR) repeat protein